MDSPLMCRYLVRAGLGSPDQMPELHLRMVGLRQGCLGWEAAEEAVVLSPQGTEVGAEFSCSSAGM